MGRLEGVAVIRLPIGGIGVSVGPEVRVVALQPRKVMTTKANNPIVSRQCGIRSPRGIIELTSTLNRAAWVLPRASKT